MDGLGDELLAGARRALNEHRGVGGGDAFEAVDDVVHLAAVADHAFEAELFVEPAIELGVLPAESEAGRGLLGHGT